MAHTNSTPNYNLPQFLGTDKPAWLTDINNAMSDIDTAIAAAKSTADSADTAVSALGITVGNHTTQLSTLSGAVTSQGNTLNTVTALIGNGTPTTTDQTIIGAINEINAKVSKGSVSVTADGVKTIAQLIGELAALVDYSKVTKNSALIVDVGSRKKVYQPSDIRAALSVFVHSSVESQNLYMNRIVVSQNNAGSFEVRGTTYTDLSSTVETSGTVYTIEY